VHHVILRKAQLDALLLPAGSIATTQKRSAGDALSTTVYPSLKKPVQVEPQLIGVGVGPGALLVTVPCLSRSCSP
jgi:hypothetical protein